MKITRTFSMSQWAYKECSNGNNTESIRDLITHSYYAYKYCTIIKTDPILLTRIRDKHAFDYCQHIEDREELWSNMSNSWAYWYCLYYVDRDIIWRNITLPKWAFHYCKNIKNRPELIKYFIGKERTFKSRRNYSKIRLVKMYRSDGSTYYE